MNDSERHLAETLVGTGRLRPEQLQDCLGKKKDGEGLVDTLVRQGTVATSELEAALSELSKEDLAPAADDPLLATVRRLDRYVILGSLGKGGMGRVYLAYDGKLKRTVALKAMRTEGSEDLARYRREVEIAASLQHPNIAAIYDAHSADDIFVIAMQYVDGRSLDSLRLPPREALEAVAQAAWAVHHAHERGIIHRDIKPANLIQTRDGRVFVLDFGIARPMKKGAALTQTGHIVGTPAYMSPEQAEGGALDARTDVYSLGATLYALVTGRLPYEGGSFVEILRKLAVDEPAPPRKAGARIHRDIETIIRKAMGRAPEQRYPTVKDFAKDIQRFLSGESIEARPMGLTAQVLRYLRRKPWAMALVAAAVVGLAVAGVLLWRQRAQRERLAQAAALTDRAARIIEDWDRLMYAPPEQDLTGERLKLEQAVQLCEAAERLAGSDPVSTPLQTARALARLGREGEAEEVLTRAVARRPDDALYLERTRVRLQRIARKLMDVSKLSSLEYVSTKSIRPVAIVRDQIRKEFEGAILEDLSLLRRFGEKAALERATIDAVERALQEDFDAADRIATAALTGASVWDQAELHRLLSWIHYLSYLADAEKEAREAKDFAASPKLLRAREHASAAVKIRRADADLYLLRAGIQISIASMPWLTIHGSDGKDLSEEEALKTWKAHLAHVREHAAMLEARSREIGTAAKIDIETALKIRPKDVDALVLLASAHFAFASMADWIGLMDFSYGRPPTPQELKAMQPATKRIEEASLVPAEAVLREALAINPDHAMAWVQLSMVHWSGSWMGLFRMDLDAIRRPVDTITRALEHHPGRHVEPLLRNARAMTRAWWCMYAGMMNRAKRSEIEAEIRLLKEDLGWLKKEDAELVERLSEMLEAMPGLEDLDPEAK